MKNTPQASNGLNKLIGTYATIYGNKELVGVDTYNNKVNDGCREESLSSTPLQMCTNQEIHREIHSKRPNSDNIAKESR